MDDFFLQGDSLITGGFPLGQMLGGDGNVYLHPAQLIAEELKDSTFLTDIGKDIDYFFARREKR